MARLLRWCGILAGGVLFRAAAGFGGFWFASDRVIGRTYALPPSQVHSTKDPAAIQRGKHFVAAYGCTDCHRPNLQGAFIPDS